MEKNHFHGQQNLNEGNRRGSDRILPELLPYATAELLGTGNPQTIPHDLGVVPKSVIAIPTDISSGFVVTEGDHTKDAAVITVTNGAKFKLLVL